MNPIASFFAGIIGAFAPCVVVLIPLVVYRFFNKEEKQLKQFLLFILGFLSSYVLLAFVIQKIFTSGLQNGFKLGFGFLFIAVGILALMKKISPLTLPYVKNSFLLGILYSLLISVNPCTLPYLSLIIAINNTGAIFLNLFVFGFGLLIPSLLFAIFGSAILKFASKYGNAMNVAEYFVNSILVLAGVYLIVTLRNFGSNDMIVGAIMLLLLFFLLLSFIRKDGLKGLLHISTILLIIGLLLIILAVYYYCNSYIQNQVAQELGQCSLEIMKCKTCNRCISIFSVGAVVGTIGILLENLFRRKK